MLEPQMRVQIAKRLRRAQKFGSTINGARQCECAVLLAARQLFSGGFTADRAV